MSILIYGFYVIFLNLPFIFQLYDDFPPHAYRVIRVFSWSVQNCSRHQWPQSLTTTIDESDKSVVIQTRQCFAAYAEILVNSLSFEDPNIWMCKDRITIHHHVSKSILCVYKTFKHVECDTLPIISILFLAKDKYILYLEECLVDFLKYCNY